MSYRVTTYKEAFEGVLGVSFDRKMREFVKGLERDGHTEKSIAYSVWKSQEKLLKFKNDSRFIGVLKNEILKYSWPNGDPRWDNYWKKRNEEEKTKKISEELKQKQIAENRKLGAQKAKETRYKNRYPGFIYFIQGEYGGAIKIGFSKNPEGRLKQLQTGYPDTLKMLCLVPGSNKDESDLHLEFQNFRLNGEWFKPEREIFDKIESLKILNS